MATYVVSDVHGYYNLFMNVLSKVGFSDSDYLWLIGDAIDRGPDGIRILQYVMNHNNMDLIIGNHELMMLNSVSQQGNILCDGPDASIWLGANGGWTTLEGYKSLSPEDRLSLLEWLKTRYVIKTLEINESKYCLSHSFYNTECENKRYNELNYLDVWNITWSSIWRDDYCSHALDIYPKYDYQFVIGHVPVQFIRRERYPLDNWNILKLLRYKNVINIDGGCSMGIDEEINNGMILLRIDDMQEFPLLLRDNR